MPLWSRAFHAEDSTAHKIFLADPHRRETGRFIGVPQFGLVAEEVEKVNPDLVTHDAKGDIYTVRYEAVSVMLLNEFLKEHKAFLEEQRKVQKFEAALAAVNKRLKEQEAKIERVSAQIEITKAAPQVVGNSR